MLGFISGQTLRFSVGNLSTPEEGSEPVRAQVKLYDAEGYILTQSEEVALRPGQFRTFGFNRDDLALAGEPDTGRLQVRAGIQVAFMDGSVRTFNPDDFPASMELVDNRTAQQLFFLRIRTLRALHEPANLKGATQPFEFIMIVLPLLQTYLAKCVIDNATAS